MATVQDFARLLGGRLWLLRVWLGTRREFLCGDSGMELATLECDGAGMLAMGDFIEGRVSQLRDAGLPVRFLSKLVFEGAFVGLVLLTIASSAIEGRGGKWNIP